MRAEPRTDDRAQHAGVTDPRACRGPPQVLRRRARDASLHGPHVVVGEPGIERGSQVRFEKWQALGNDYIIVEVRALPFELTAARVRLMCATHTGVGSDGILLLSDASDPRFVASLRIFNPDGSEAELSGNGAREAILYLRAHGWTNEDEFSIQTAAGEIRPRITGEDTCTVGMGRASVRSKDFPSGGEDGTGTLTSAGREFRFQHVAIGNPQCAIEVEPGELEQLDLQAFGPGIEANGLFPNRTNVSFWRRDASTQIS